MLITEVHLSPSSLAFLSASSFFNFSFSAFESFALFFPLAGGLGGFLYKGFNKTVKKQFTDLVTNLWVFESQKIKSHNWKINLNLCKFIINIRQ